MNRRQKKKKLKVQLEVWKNDPSIEAILVKPNKGADILDVSRYAQSIWEVTGIPMIIVIDKATAERMDHAELVKYVNYVKEIAGIYDAGES